MADHNRALSPLVDLLIPGDRRWPSASAVGVVAADIAAEVDRETFAWIMALASATAPELAEAEKREPLRFGRMLDALYRAYYTTPAVQAVVTELANAAPREPSAHFDERLVVQVVSRQSGRRRL